MAEMAIGCAICGALFFMRARLDQCLLVTAKQIDEKGHANVVTQRYLFVKGTPIQMAEPKQLLDSVALAAMRRWLWTLPHCEHRG